MHHGETLQEKKVCHNSKGIILGAAKAAPKVGSCCCDLTSYAEQNFIYWLSSGQKQAKTRKCGAGWQVVRAGA